MKFIRLALTAVVLSACSAISEASPSRIGSERHELSANWGTFGARDTVQLFRFGLEYRALPLSHSLRPIIGANYLEDGGSYVYAGARISWEPRPNWRLSPSFAAGIYNDATFDLGGPVEFRSGLDIGHRIHADWWLEVGGYHLSNGGIYNRNNGSEVVQFSLTYTF